VVNIQNLAVVFIMCASTGKDKLGEGDEGRAEEKEVKPEDEARQSMEEKKAEGAAAVMMVVEGVR